MRLPKKLKLAQCERQMLNAIEFDRLLLMIREYLSVYMTLIYCPNQASFHIIGLLSSCFDRAPNHSLPSLMMMMMIDMNFEFFY